MSEKLHDLAFGISKKCQICGSGSLTKILNFGHFAPCDSLLTNEALNFHETSYPLNLVVCDDCSLAQIDYVVDPETLFYPDYPYRSGITKTLVQNLMSTGPKIMAATGITDGSALDIGSNDGTLLQGFKNSGMNVLGVEPTNIAKIANANGIQTIQEFFTRDLATDIFEKHGSFKVVTAANMFAHVAKLASLIEGVRYLLDDDGVFVTESHYLLDLLETVQYDSIYHEHLKYYTIRSLDTLFSYYDMSIVDCELIPNYGGSIRVFAKKGKGLKASERLKNQKKVELDFFATDRQFDRFVTRVNKSKYDLQLFLADCKKEGKTVRGVGSPGRAATLLKFCNVDISDIKYIAEQSTSLKLGLHMPNTHIPIVDEALLFEEQPDYVLMLSWHYWQPIADNLRKKGLKSKIVLPLPELTVVE